MSRQDFNDFVDTLTSQIQEFNEALDRAVTKKDAGAKMFDLLNLQKKVKGPQNAAQEKQFEKERKIADNHAQNGGGIGVIGMFVGTMGTMTSFILGAPEVAYGFIALLGGSTATTIYAVGVETQKKDADGNVVGYKVFKTKKQKSQIQHMQKTLAPHVEQMISLEEKIDAAINDTLNTEAYALVHSPVYDALKTTYPNMRNAFLNAAEKALKESHPAHLTKRNKESELDKSKSTGVQLHNKKGGG